MAKSNIRYFVELEPGNHNYRGYISSKKHLSRKEFANDHGDMFRVHGAVFRPDQVHAEPRKKNPLLEMALAVLFTWAMLKFVPGPDLHISPARWLFGIALSALLGFLWGRLRIDMQQVDADKFNKS